MGDREEYLEMGLSEDEIAALDEDDDFLEEGDDDDAGSDGADEGTGDEESDGDADAEGEQDDERDGSDDSDSEEDLDESGQADAEADDDDSAAEDDEGVQGGSDDDDDIRGDSGDDSGGGTADKGTGEADRDSEDGRDEQSADPDAKSIDDVIAERVAALDAELDEGNLSFEQYKVKLLELGNERMDARMDEKIKTAREEERQAAADARWKDEQAEFFGQKENKYLTENEPRFQAFAAEVNRLTSDKDWRGKPGKVVLQEAQKNFNEAFGIEMKPRPKGKDKPDENKDKPDENKGKKAVRDAKKAGASRSAPKTLKDVPASDRDEAELFDYLDDLEGAALEEALGKLSPEEYAAYENA